MSGVVRDPVPVAPLREHFLECLARGEFTASEIASRLGWTRGRVGSKCNAPDASRVQRMFGIRGGSSTKPNGKRYVHPPRELVNYSTAVLLCRAMGADPVDFDL